MEEKSKIVHVYGDSSVSFRKNIDFSSLVGRKIIDFSPHCGTYGQGGPGFAGFKLEALRDQPEEWLILCIWGAPSWLTVNGQWLEAHPEQYDIQRPLISNFSGQSWNEFSPQVVGLTISHFDVSEKSFTIDIGEAKITLSEDSKDRPPYPAGNAMELMPDDDLRQAWILATAPWVNV